MVIRARMRLLASMGGACASAVACPACADPLQDQAVASLGPENPNVPLGPGHRPGQPCLTCHGASGPASIPFSVGGTVYATQGGAKPADQALVRIEDIDGHLVTAKTNIVGNFYVLLTEFQLHYPIQMKVTSSDGAQTSQMFTVSNRAGSCADCHSNPPGPNSPGPVFVFPNFGGSGDGGIE
jgi:hypothetical protein